MSESNMYTPRDEGYYAYTPYGDPDDENPFDIGTEEYFSWYRGWEKADEDYNDERSYYYDL